jgi:hypothetical protein
MQLTLSDSFKIISDKLTYRFAFDLLTRSFENQKYHKLRFSYNCFLLLKNLLNKDEIFEEGSDCYVSYMPSARYLCVV